MRDDRARSRILVVDDEAAMREIYRAVLTLDEGEGATSDRQQTLETELFGETVSDTTRSYDIQQCRQGEEAVEAVRRAVEDDMPFAVAFIDVRMPPGIDGVAAAAQIRAIDPNLNIVIVTGYSDVEIGRIAERVPPADKLLYCQKPLHAPEILQLAGALTEKWHLEKRTNLLFHAVEQSAACVLITDVKGDIEYVNASFTESTGYRPDEVIGRNYALLKSNETPESVYDEVWRTVQGGDAWTGELRNRKQGGDLIWERVRMSPVKSAAGRIEYFMCLSEDITARKKLEEQLAFRANYDDVTGLPNRTLTLDRLGQSVKHAKRTGDRVALLVVTIDDFDKITSSLAPSELDRLLVGVAERLSLSIHAAETLFPLGVETLARLDGATFAAILPELAHDVDVQFVSEKLIGALELPFRVGGQELFLTASAGVTIYPTDGSSAEVLLRNARAAAQQSRERGGNAFSFFTPQLDKLAQERLEIEACVMRALRGDGFDVHFQPIVDSRSRRPVAAEALVRCRDADGGLIPPDQFIPLAERTGIIGAIGEFVLTEACRNLREWRDNFAPAMKVAVNVSARQFHTGELGDRLADLLDQFQLPADALELEITESLLLDEAPEVEETFRAIGNLGVALSIDDFGTGYSSLSALRRFPLDTLKIDRAFVQGALTNRDDATLTETIITMAHSLGLHLIGEGVETPEQLAFLSDHGCEFAQGFLFGKPMPASEFEASFRRLEPVLERS